MKFIKHRKQTPERQCPCFLVDFFAGSMLNLLFFRVLPEEVMRGNATFVFVCLERVGLAATNCDGDDLRGHRVVDFDSGDSALFFHDAPDGC